MCLEKFNNFSLFLCLNVGVYISYRPCAHFVYIDTDGEQVCLFPSTVVSLMLANSTGAVVLTYFGKFAHIQVTLH